MLHNFLKLVRSELDALLATGLGLSGSWLVANKNPIGFLLYIGCSGLWIGFGVRKKIATIVIFETVYLLLHIRGYLKWNEIFF